MRFIPAPRHLAPWVLGVTVLRAAQERVVVVPAHALAVFTLVQRGALHDGLQVFASPGVLAGRGSAGTAQAYVAAAGTVSASLLCLASILPLLTGEAAAQFADGCVPPHLLGLDEGALHDRLGGCPTDEAIASALLAQVDRALRMARAPRASATRFASALAGWSPGPHVRPPRDWAERQWQRACRAELGVSPKFLQRLGRVHASVRDRMAHAGGPLSQHALDAGFFDQAHMAREYRLLAGAAPRESLARDDGAAAGIVLGASQIAPRFFSR